MKAILNDVENYVTESFHDLHPLDRAQAFRKVQAWASERAREQERINTDQGVPDRPRFSDED